MDKNLKINKVAGDKIVAGINKLADIVKVTMGPKGKLVFIENMDGGFPIVTKDGVTVSESVDLVCQYEKMGVRLIQQAGKKLLEETADSTTTATVLTQALINEGINSNKDFRELQENYTKDLAEVEKAFNKYSKKVKSSELEKVATISANGDKEIGQIVAKAFKEVGKNGNVSVEELFKEGIKLEIQDGYKLESGFMTPEFITNRKIKEVHLERPLVLISTSDITNVSQIEHVIRFSLDNARTLLIICPSMSDEVLRTLVYNRHLGAFNGCVVRLPETGSRRDDLVEDLLFLTKSLGTMDPENDFDLENLGELDYAYVKGTFSSLSLQSDVNTDGLIKELENELKTSESTETSWLKKRIGNLIAKVATIKVGGLSEGERRERIDRVDDAVGSVRSSFVSGVIPGGGSFLHFISEELDLSPEFRKAIKAPFETILNNSGTLTSENLKLNFNQGYNVYNGEFLNDMKGEGIIDSSKSILMALEIAVSISKTVLQTGGLILTRN